MNPDSNNANGKNKAPEKPASVLNPGVTPWLRHATQAGPSSAPALQNPEVLPVSVAANVGQSDEIEVEDADITPNPIFEVGMNIGSSRDPNVSQNRSLEPTSISNGNHIGDQSEWRPQGQNMGEVHDFERLKHQGKVKRDMQMQEQQQREKKDADNLRLCRMHFFIGCFGLPLLHFVNVMYFYPEWSGENRNFHIQRYIWFSIIIGLVQSFIWILWYVVFQISDSLDNMSILNTNSTIVGTLSR